MDRRRGDKLKKLFNNISTRDMIGAELQERTLIYNVIGFIEMTPLADNANLISNLGIELASREYNTCIVDFDVLYPSLYNRLDVWPNPKGQGIYTFLRNDKTEVKEHLNMTKYDNLMLLSASPQDLFEEYFEFRLEQVEKAIDELKDIFDIVLVNIPNNPAFEFCIAALKSVHLGFMVCSETIEASTNIIKMLSFLKSLGISTAKLSNVIMMNTMGLGFDYKGFDDIGVSIACNLPYINGLYQHSLENQIYLKQSSGYNKQFITELRGLADQLVEG